MIWDFGPLIPGVINGVIKDPLIKSSDLGMNDEMESNDWEISSISQHPDFTSLGLR